MLDLTRVEAVQLSVVLHIMLNESPQFRAKIEREQGTVGIASLESVLDKVNEAFGFELPDGP